LASPIRRAATIPITGCSPCAADCTGRLTVGMKRDFADGEARAATASHACGTAGVLTVNAERPSGPGCAHDLTRCRPNPPRAATWSTGSSPRSKRCRCNRRCWSSHADLLRGGPAGQLLDAEAKQLGATSMRRQGDNQVTMLGALTAPTPDSCRNSIRCRQQRALCRRYAGQCAFRARVATAPIGSRCRHRSWRSGRWRAGRSQ
jgi:hypothetical protein